MEKIELFDKVDRVFSKEPLTKEVIGNDAFKILRALSMKPEYTESINAVQKYAGVLGWRIGRLLQEMFTEADRSPFLDWTKKEEKYERFSDRASAKLRELFLVGRARFEEYIQNLWVTEEEISALWGMND